MYKLHKFWYKDKILSNYLKQICLQSTSAGSQTAVNSKDDITFAQEWQQAKSFEEIPTLTVFQLMKNFLPGGKYSKMDAAQMIMSVRDELGPITRLKGMLGNPDAIMTHNPEDFEKALRNEGPWPVRPGADAMHYHRGVHRADFFQGVEGLLPTQGTQWGTFRTVVNPVLMQPKNVRIYLKKMSQVNKEFMERIIQIRDPNTFEVPATFEEELNRWALESVSTVALDKQLGLLTENRDDAVVKKLFQLLTDFFTLSVDVEFKPPIWKYYKTKSFRKLMETLDAITEITSTYVNEAVERIEQERLAGVPEKSENDKSVLEKLIKIDKKMAMVMAMDMLMAGVDTTTTAFTGICMSLAKNPEKQAKLREEIMKVLPHKDSEFDEVAFNNMPYLRACIKESLRLFPVVIGNARLPVNDLVLSGYRVPKGNQVTLVYLSLLTDNNYYPRASEYLPERWLRSAKDADEVSECPNALKATNPFTYFPFGFGKRSCIGRRIVEMEMELGIARLVRNFHIEFNYPTENAFKTLFIRMPIVPLKFTFKDVAN